MPTITKTIGTTGRDYSTFTSWESLLDDTGIYTSGDIAKGECYADSILSGESNVSINGGGTVGLASRLLTVAAGERHDGTAGTGFEYNPSSNDSGLSIGISNTTIEWMEISANGAPANPNPSGIGCGDALSGINVRRNIIKGFRCRDAYNLASGIRFTHSGMSSSCVCDNIVYDIDQANGSPSDYARGIVVVSINSSTKVHNNTVHGINVTPGTGGSGFSVECDLVNNISTGTGGDDYDASSSPTAESYNLSSDTTAAGTGSLTSKTAANQFVTVGSNFHLKTGADAIDAGTDLGAGNEQEIDIDGRDRDAEGDTWDMGADEFVAAGGDYPPINRSFIAVP